jgi:single-stranded-DNA-specific exonuclease
MSKQSNKEWKYILNVDELGLDNLEASLLEERGINDISEFQNPSLKNVPNSDFLFDSKTAAKKIIKAIKAKKKIYIHGDFDCDGVCSTAILWEFLYKEVSKILDIKVDVVPYIPNRLDEGYGLSKKSLDTMKENGAQLIITVDCGIRDGKIIEENISKDLDFIVTDHHQPADDFIANGYTVVHPMLKGHEYPLVKICGSTVAFLLTQAIRKELKVEYEITEDTPGLDLVALATVTDLMPLVDINRALVVFGLKQMSQSPRLGIQSLLNLSNINPTDLDTYHFGFVIGPRINAAGRIGHAMDALKLVLAPNEKSAMEYSSILFNLNQKRQDGTDQLLQQAESLLPEFENENLIFISGQGWHEGIIGLVAGRIFEKTGKPTLIISNNGDEIRGSARSIPEFDITKALEIHSQYLEKYGGHTQAAGFSVKKGEIDNFKESILKYAKENLNFENIKTESIADILISPINISYELYNILEKFKPYGYGNQKPTVMIKGLKIVEKKTMSEGKHLKLKCIKDSSEISLLMFNCWDDIKILDVGMEVDIIGNLSKNEWNGNINIEILIKEYKLVE